MTRAERLMPNGIPRHVRIYDNGGATADRYTVIFSGRWKGRRPGWTFLLAMSAKPFHPQGIGLHDEIRGEIDRPRYSHLGKKIRFQDLPEDCQRAVLTDYREIWDLK